jgi:hypothetical protein
MQQRHRNLVTPMWRKGQISTNCVIGAGGQERTVRKECIPLSIFHERFAK